MSMLTFLSFKILYHCTYQPKYFVIFKLFDKVYYYSLLHIYKDICLWYEIKSFNLVFFQNYILKLKSLKKVSKLDSNF